jgi:transposase InsO family protein
MIVDHGCSRAAIFIPCTTSVTGEGIAKLYFKNVYQWFGLPNKVISDRDPRFTSHFAKALCSRLGIDQNVSTVFHPQTDGLMERKNQWVEQFLRTITMHQQNDWACWLPLATAVNATTEVPPSQALLGCLPRLDHRLDEPTMNPQVEERKETAFKKREQAKTALNRVANITPKAIPRKRYGLAQWQKSSPPLSDAQAGPSTSWPLCYHPSNIPRGPPAKTTTDLDHP